MLEQASHSLYMLVCMYQVGYAMDDCNRPYPKYHLHACGFHYNRNSGLHENLRRSIRVLLHIDYKFYILDIVNLLFMLFVRQYHYQVRERLFCTNNNSGMRVQI